MVYVKSYTINREAFLPTGGFAAWLCVRLKRMRGPEGSVADTGHKLDSMLKKLTILTRLTLGYVIIMLLVFLMGGYVIVKLKELKKLAFQYEALHGAVIQKSENLLEMLISQAGLEKKYWVSKDLDFYEEFIKAKDVFTRNLVQLVDLLKRISMDEGGAEIQNRYASYVTLVTADAALPEEVTENSEPHTLEKETLINDMTRLFQDLIRGARSNRDEKIRQSAKISEEVLNVTSVTGIVVVVIGLLISVFTTRGINRSLHLLKAKTHDITQGRFDQISGVDSPPEIKSLADDFNGMCERLKELDQMKLDFISHVSHELRTPLTAIREATSMLMEGTYAHSPESQKNLLAITREASERLIASVNRILDLSRMEARMMSYQFKPSSLKPLIQSVVDRLDPLSHRKKIRVDTVIPDDLPAVRMDPDRIEQVLENLVGNALKFCMEEGRIFISAVMENDNEPWVKVAVSDTGKGIPRESLEAIFEKFRRIESGRETVRGTGLGLSIAKHIVSAHGGSIWAESTLGKGATFYFTLPVA